MNIEEKTKLAHEYAIEMAKQGISLRSCKELGWKYADQMEAEAEKRIKAKSEKDAEESKVIFKSLMENEDGSCKHFHTTLNRGECFDCGEKLNSTNSSQLEFQVDWSVAPEWAVYWFMDETLASWWSKREPYFLSGGVSKIVINNVNSFAPSFNYCGDWAYSLRKRPK